VVTIARWGLSTLFWTTLILGWAVVVVPGGWPRWAMAVVAALLWLFVLAFFRNPARRPAGGPSSFIAPADGVVADITELTPERYLDEPCVRIGIFLSVFDVHVNRSPIAGRIEHVHYQPGAFLDARHPSATHENEANELGLVVTAPGALSTRILVRQISGLIARRIVCTHGVGDQLGQGELFGMIKFGSRTELVVPQSALEAVRVTVGQRVRCGETVIAELRAAAADAPEATAAGDND
jgi:phosphatidylserine decarboxylase